MPRTASPIVFPGWPHYPYTDFEKSFMDNPSYQCWYDRIIMHWENGSLKLFFYEQLIVQDKQTGQYFWPHGQQLIPVTSLEKVMSTKYFFQCDVEVE